MEKLPSNVVHLPIDLKYLENSDLPPKISKKQLNMNPKKFKKKSKKSPYKDLKKDLLLGQPSAETPSSPPSKHKHSSQQLLPESARQPL